MTPVMPTYARAPSALVEGKGAWVEDEAGARYLDFGAGVAVNALGHAHPHLVAELTEQAQKLWHVSNLFRMPGQERLAQRLVDATFADTVFFTNSGAEAMECAIKMARKFQDHDGRPERYRIITFDGAFHGRTLATIAAAGRGKLVEGFGPMPDGFDILPFADHEAIEAAIGPETAAILIEPVQGEGGVRPVPTQCLRGLRDLCDQHELLLIFDEVQTGVGRSGKLFAHEWSGAAPDVMAVAKGIGGGFPLGACLATARAAAGMTPGTHGSTYGGNPLAMAVGNAVLDVVLADGFLEHVSRISGRLRQRLEGLAAEYPDAIDHVRGEGLLLGIVAKIPAGDVIAAAREEGLIVLPAAENVVRVAPPLILTEDEADEGVKRLDAAFRRAAAQAGRAA